MVHFSTRTAEAARWILTKEKFGVQYSVKNLKDSFDNEYEEDVLTSLAHIASDDSFFPKLVRWSVRSKNDGFNGQNMVCLFMILDLTRYLLLCHNTNIKFVPYNISGLRQCV